jgi:hypothetical protein
MIDDIDYLKENSEKDYVVIFVDSQKRDYATFPTPSEYSITFDQPFKNVYSIEILDASIPTTMYNIDIYSQDLYATTVSRQRNNAIDHRTYIYELSTSTYFSELFESQHQNYLLVCSDAHLTSYDVDNVLYTSDNTEYRIAVRYTIENVEIMKKTNQSETEFHFFEYLGKPYAIRNIPGNAPIISIIGEKNYNLQSSGENLYTLTYFVYKFVSQTVYNSIVNDLNYWVAINNYRIAMTKGNYDVQAFRFALNNVLNDATNIFVEPVGLFDTLQGKFRYFSTDLLLFNARHKRLDNVLGFDLMPTIDDADIYTSIQIGDNNRVFMGNYDATNKVYYMISPGMINLSGERYLILRCPEIEDHLYGSYAYNSNTPGLGMFKIAAGQNEITNLRWDYATLLRKPIHPIGKLSKLTFRFEVTSGNLYDFKGINHQFMIAIKFYIPSRKEKFNRSSLNPNYNPNLIEYMAASKNIRNRENSDNEEEIDNEIDNEHEYKMYKKMLEKYDYSSSDAEEESEDQESDSEISV